MATVMIVGIGLGIYYGITQFVNTSIYARFLMLDNASSTRLQLYKDAVKFWKMSPIFGIGFGQYQVFSSYRLYSHSTYAEILACTGIIGCLLFFIPLFAYSFKLLKNAFCKKSQNNYEAVIRLSMLFIELLLGATMIFIYDFSHMLILLYLFTTNREKIDYDWS